MCLAEDDYLIEALVTDRSDQSLSMAVLPRRPSCGRTVADSHCANPAAVCWTECTVAVADEVAWRRVPGKSFRHLPGYPFGGRMGSDAKTYQSATLVTEDHQTVEQFKERGRYHEQIDRCDTCCMITQKALPAL